MTNEPSLENKIHVLEDKILRSKNYREQLELRIILMDYRRQQQDIRMKNIAYNR